MQEEESTNKAQTEANATVSGNDDQTPADQADEEKPSAAESKESETAETEEKANECDTPRTGTPHDESDDDDNITVTVPKPHTYTNNFHDYRDRSHMNGRYNRQMNTTDMESAQMPTQQHSVSHLFRSISNGFN